jgi:hypothetical protein
MDTSKRIFQLHGVDGAEQPILRKTLPRDRMLAFFQALPPTVVALGSVRRLAPLGEGAWRDGAHSEADRAAVGQALCRARQERRG